MCNNFLGSSLLYPPPALQIQSLLLHYYFLDPHPLSSLLTVASLLFSSHLFVAVFSIGDSDEIGYLPYTPFHLSSQSLFTGTSALNDQFYPTSLLASTLDHDCLYTYYLIRRIWINTRSLTNFFESLTQLDYL